MLPLAFAINCLILVPLTFGLLSQQPGMDGPYGPDTDARRILTCLYLTIAVVSLFALVKLGMGQRDVAMRVAWVLFPMQIIYKLATVPIVGLGNPVVVTNLAVVALLSVTLLTMRA